MLDAVIRAWWDDNPDRCGTRTEFDNKPDGRLHIAIVMVIEGQPPHEWGFLVGDILLDLRSTLDYIAYQAVIAHTGQDPPPNPRRIEFPIYKDEGFYRPIGDVADEIA